MGHVIGCIGCGNMGGALLGGFASALQKDGASFLCHDHSACKMEALQQLGVGIAPDCRSLAQKSDIIILAVKPYGIPAVLDEISEEITADKIVVSIAAGISLAALRSRLGNRPAICRCMPTTTAKVGKGVFAFCFDSVSRNEILETAVLSFFAKLGFCLQLPENKFTAYSAYIGAGPAYVFEMMQALAQAGITLGFSASQNRQMLVELFAGCAELAASEKTSFTELRDAVCSPAGLTIAGVNKLDRAGFNGMVVEAVEAAYRRGLEMES